MIPTVFAYVIAASFFAIEPFLRQGATAKSLETTDSDKGSSTLIVALFGIVVVLPPLLNFFHVGHIAFSVVTWLGVFIMLLGLGLRIWSMRVLGAYYSRTLRVAEAQVIITKGPYRVVRHPGYLGTICVWIGFGLGNGNWIATVVVAFLLFGVYGYRIRSEEIMLIGRFGEQYQEYRQRTWRLLPFIY
jgi:protein-S-isoprenylcysteine O-methyltransferase Ste14